MYKWNIKNKLITTMMLVTALGMSIVTIAFYVSSFGALEKRLFSRINTQMDILAQNIGATLLFLDEASAEDMLSSFAVDHAIVSAEVRDHDKEPFALYSADGGDTPPKSAIKFQRDLRVGEEIVGGLTVHVSLREIEEQGRQLFIQAIVVLAVSSLVVLGAAIRLQNIFSKPILELDHLAQQVSETNNYSLRAKVMADDEIGSLARHFNKMMTQVDERDRMLESQVRARTIELESLAEQFRHRAFHDELTGLANRALLTEQFESLVKSTRRKGKIFAILLLDLDNFKTINDTLGHNVGDELLTGVSKRLVQSVRAEDIIARLGGDEFMILLTNLNKAEDAEMVAQKILENLRRDFFLTNRTLHVTGSIGISLFPAHGEDLISLSSNADLAMYQAKQMGRNMHAIFHQGLGLHSEQRMLAQTGLRRALSEHQLEMFYQPKLDAHTQQVVGCEALIRWRHPQRGLVFPDEFIPYAEENGLITEVDTYALRESCRQIRRWSEASLAMPVAVNFSPHNFTDGQVIERIKNILEETGVAPEFIEIEITEATLINNAEQATEVLNTIRELGVKTYLDDFGMRYASLEYLRNLHFDAIKLDRSFVAGLFRDEKGGRLIQGIIALAKQLGVKIVAEGVETAEQATFLAEHGCDYLQGYYYLKPVPEREFIQWYQSRKA